MKCRYCRHFKPYGKLSFGEIVFVEIKIFGRDTEIHGLCTKYLRPVSMPRVRCRGFRQDLRGWHPDKTLVDLMIS